MSSRTQTPGQREWNNKHANYWLNYDPQRVKLEMPKDVTLSDETLNNIRENAAMQGAHMAVVRVCPDNGDYFDVEYRIHGQNSRSHERMKRSSSLLERLSAHIKRRRATIAAGAALVLSICMAGCELADDHHGNGDELPPGAVEWAFGRFDGSHAERIAEAAIADLHVSDKGNGMSYRWVRGSCEDLGAEDKSDAERTLACLFYQDEESGVWRGGKFDFISTSRTTRSLNNIRNGYRGWNAEAFFDANRHAFVIVSTDGKKRTNWIFD